MNRNTDTENKELFDICDANGIPTGETVEREKAHAEGICHRTAHVWVIRRDRHGVLILMQKRSDDKDSFPGCFDTSSAGHIRAGDEPEESAVRELAEELGICAQPSELTFAGIFRNEYAKEFHGRMFRDNEVANVFVCEKDVNIAELNIQKEELSEVRWFDLEFVYQEKLRHNEEFCVPVEGLRTLMKYLGIEYQN